MRAKKNYFVEFNLKFRIQLFHLFCFVYFKILLKMPTPRLLAKLALPFVDIDAFSLSLSLSPSHSLYRLSFLSLSFILSLSHTLSLSVVWLCFFNIQPPYKTTPTWRHNALDFYLGESVFPLSPPFFFQHRQDTLWSER